MSEWFRNLDRLLRGELTKPEELRSGKVLLPARKLIAVSLLLGAVAGVCMGLYAATGGRQEPWQPLLASAIKVPALFLLTLLVTFPSLYVFAALANSRLGMRDTLRLLVAAIAVMLGVLASFGPVVAFFTLSNDSHTFMVFLNVLFFALAGGIGLAFLHRAVKIVFPDEVSYVAAESAEAGSSKRRNTSTRARGIFRVWLIIFGVVGAQMAWILRPFIGSPHLPFAWFRPRWLNFFEYMARLLTDTW
ncbi:MAG: hypothetical protein ACT4PU_08225 [Planctomycetota bacterium]